MFGRYCGLASKAEALASDFIKLYVNLVVMATKN
jgi:hypothetical protein